SIPRRTPENRSTRTCRAPSVQNDRAGRAASAALRWGRRRIAARSRKHPTRAFRRGRAQKARLAGHISGASTIAETPLDQETGPARPGTQTRRSQPASSTKAARPRPGSRKHQTSPTTRTDLATVSIATLARALSPTRSRLASARLLDQRTRAKPRQYIDQQHLAALCFDNLVTHHLLARVVAPFHQHARFDLGDQLYRRVFVEQHDQVHRLQGGQHLRARTLIL